MNKRFNEILEYMKNHDDEEFYEDEFEEAKDNDYEDGESLAEQIRKFKSDGNGTDKEEIKEESKEDSIKEESPVNNIDFVDYFKKQKEHVDQINAQQIEKQKELAEQQQLLSEDIRRNTEKQRIEAEAFNQRIMNSHNPLREPETVQKTVEDSNSNSKEADEVMKSPKSDTIIQNNNKSIEELEQDLDSVRRKQFDENRKRMDWIEHESDNIKIRMGLRNATDDVLLNNGFDETYNRTTGYINPKTGERDQDKRIKRRRKIIYNTYVEEYNDLAYDQYRLEQLLNPNNKGKVKKLSPRNNVNDQRRTIQETGIATSNSNNNLMPTSTPEITITDERIDTQENSSIPRLTGSNAELQILAEELQYLKVQEEAIKNKSSLSEYDKQTLEVIDSLRKEVIEEVNDWAIAYNNKQPDLTEDRAISSNDNLNSNNISESPTNQVDNEVVESILAEVIEPTNQKQGSNQNSNPDPEIVDDQGSWITDENGQQNTDQTQTGTQGENPSDNGSQGNPDVSFQKTTNLSDEDLHEIVYNEQINNNDINPFEKQIPTPISPVDLTDEDLHEIVYNEQMNNNDVNPFEEYFPEQITPPTSPRVNSSKYYLSTAAVTGNNFIELITQIQDQLTTNNEEDILKSINYETIEKMFLGKEYNGQKLNITKSNLIDFYNDIYNNLEEKERILAGKIITKMTDIVEGRTKENDEINIRYIPEKTMDQNERYFNNKGYINYQHVNSDLRSLNIDSKNATLDDLRNKFKNKDGSPNEEKSKLLHDIINSENYKNHKKKGLKAFCESHKKILASAAGLGVGLGISALNIVPTVTQPLGAIRLGYAIAKPIVRIYSKNKYGDKLAVENKIKNKIETKLDSTFENSKVSNIYKGIKNGIKKINNTLKKPETQCFLNGMALGIVAGNILKANNIFEKGKTTETTDEITPNKTNPSLEDFDKTNNMSNIPNEATNNAADVLTNNWTDNITKDSSFDLRGMFDHIYQDSYNCLAGNEQSMLPIGKQAMECYDNVVAGRIKLSNGEFVNTITEAVQSGQDYTVALADKETGTILGWVKDNAFEKAIKAAQTVTKASGKSL